MKFQNEEILLDRARDLEAANFNGLAQVLVEPDNDAGHAVLQLFFHNTLFLSDIYNHLLANPAELTDVFPITGGHRIPAGPLTGQVRISGIDYPEPNNVLVLRAAPIGDYATYTLALNWTRIDPLFAEIPFKFRPRCFHLCAPVWEPPKLAPQNPAIDYLAKDYETFKHAMINAMSARVPDWAPSSEADLDQVLLEIIAAGADEISDYQDRIVNEAYIGSARKRVSLARHARLMDYHIHQGNQAGTTLAIELESGEVFSPSGDFTVQVDDDPLTTFLDSQTQTALFRVALAFGPELDAAFVSPALIDQFTAAGFTLSGNLQLQVLQNARRWTLFDLDHHHIYQFRFEADQIAVLRPTRSDLLNRLELYDWGGTLHALGVGATSADLAVPEGSESNARFIANLLDLGRQLLLQEYLNPQTGLPAGRDPQKRLRLRLTDANPIHDPVQDQWCVRINWLEDDALPNDYCFFHGSGQDRVPIALFHGNLIEVVHGQPVHVIFRPPGANLQLALQPGDPVEVHYIIDDQGVVTCPFPAPYLAFRDTPPGGQVASRSTLDIHVLAGGGTDRWDEVIDFIHSDDSPENGDHFQVEVDEHQRALIRFGNGVNGRQVPEGAVIHAFCQIGHGPSGNLGQDVLTNFDQTQYTQVSASWNPFDITNGRAPESRESIIRAAPQAWKVHQLRAVTLQDYQDRAESLPEVSRASASWRWTGSWRCVRVAIDPAGTTSLTPELRERVSRHLDAVRLIGDDLEIREPQFAALDIKVSLCIHDQYWPEDIAELLEQQFSEGYNIQGQLAFFHPDNWTFGQTLHRSQILGALHAVTGVAHINNLSITRRDGRGSASQAPPIGDHEIIRVANDSDQLELGSIRFTLNGGRQ